MSSSFPQATSAETAVLGGWDLAISAALFLQGVLCAQFAHYTNVNKRDSVWLKLFVTGLAVLTTLKTIQVLAVMWIQNVTLFENVEAASRLWATNWVPKLTPILEACIAIYVQMFFCRRLWTISRNSCIVVFCITSFSFALISAAVSAFFIFADIGSPKHATWMSIHLGAALGGDLLLTGSTAFYLLRHSKTVLPRGPTAPLLSSLLRVTIQSAAPAALVNFVATITIVTLIHKKSPGALVSLAGAASNTVLPQLYVWSALWTLNSREDIYLAADTTQCTLHPEWRGTAEESAGHRGNEMLDSQRGQDKSVSLASTEKFQQNRLKV
ncbi:hypothetical protein B0H19DRAFT_1239348 [Mycena capillaripes]|nr:hypothetical protein B0H19DRAFT_1239348 [Mycena capillaripes]